MSVDGMFLALAVLLGLSCAAGLPSSIPDAALYGLILLGVSLSVAFILLRRDRTPGKGAVLLTAALAVSSVQLLGGAGGPAAFMYPVLFLWMKRDSISGPLVVGASAMALIEFLGPLAYSSGIFGGSTDPGGILRSMNDSLIAGVIPLLSLFLVELLEERRKDIPGILLPPDEPGRDERSFPEDVARSLMPVLGRATGAGGLFLFTGDSRGIYTLNEFMVSSGSVSSRYITGPGDPVLELLKEAGEDLIHTDSRKLALSGSGGLPWYVGDPGRDHVSLLRFSRDGDIQGFLVADYDSRETRKMAAPLLVDSAFLLSVAWERSRPPEIGGFIAICDDMASVKDIKGAVHRLISRIMTSWPETTASVALLGEGGVLRVYESLGPLSEGRAGREFGLKDGFAGMAVNRREPMRRLRMKVGQKAVRTFGDADGAASPAGSCCAVPLEYDGMVFGVLTVESESEQYFAAEDLSLFKSFSSVFSLAVSRSNLRASLARLKENDRLTGFPLLSSFHAKLNDLVRGVRSRAWSITVLAVDISGFSRINETYGYNEGDRVLGETAHRIRRAVGNRAFFARAGADRFLVCLQEVDRVSAEAYAARIHEEFADSPVAAGERSTEVSVRIGGAVSHVDKMIRKLPSIAMSMAESISGKPGSTTITEVSQFYELDRNR